MANTHVGGKGDTRSTLNLAQTDGPGSKNEEFGGHGGHKRGQGNDIYLKTYYNTGMEKQTRDRLERQVNRSQIVECLQTHRAHEAAMAGTVCESKGVEKGGEDKYII